MSKRRKLYRLLRLTQRITSAIADWWDEFTPEMEREDEVRKAEEALEEVKEYNPEAYAQAVENERRTMEERQQRTTHGIL